MKIGNLVNMKWIPWEPYPDEAPTSGIIFDINGQFIHVLWPSGVVKSYIKSDLEVINEAG
jgi:hypothetical protein